MNNIFVGNLSFESTKEDVRKLFEPLGTVANVTIMERKKGKSRGYGFVDMPNEEEKNAAIAALEGKEFMGRVLSVSVVVPKVKGEHKPKKFKPEYSETKKPWVKSEARESKPYSLSKPYRQEDRSSKSYHREDRQSKPYRRDDRDTKPGGAKPYSKYSGQSKSHAPSKTWGKLGADYNPFRKDDRGSKPFRRDDRGSKPYKGGGGAKPYRRDDRDAKPYRKDDRESKPYKKFEGESKKSWPKKEGGFKPKPGGAFKMFHKSPVGSKSWPKKGQARD